MQNEFDTVTALRYYLSHGAQHGAARIGDKKMKDFKVTVTGETGSISYEVRKTAKGAESFGKKVAAEAFYGEICTIAVVEIA